MIHQFSNKTITIKQNEVLQIFSEFEAILQEHEGRKENIVSIEEAHCLFNDLCKQIVGIQTSLAEQMKGVEFYTQDNTPKGSKYPDLVEATNFAYLSAPWSTAEVLNQINTLSKLAIVSLIKAVLEGEDMDEITNKRRYTFIMKDNSTHDADAAITLSFQSNKVQFSRLFSAFKKCMTIEYTPKAKEEPKPEAEATEQPTPTENKPSQENDMNKEQMNKAKETAEDIKLESEKGASWWKTAAVATGAAVLLGGAGYLVYRNFFKSE